MRPPVVSPPSSESEDEVVGTKPDKITAALNACYQELVWFDELENKEKPLVCTVCDTFMKPFESDSLEMSKFASLKKVLMTPIAKGLPKDLKSCYKFEVPSAYKEHVKGVLLSPRGRYIHHIPSAKGSQKKAQCSGSMSVCKGCKRSLEKKEIPKFAIANGFFVGTPPKCLLELTDIERAWITPVKTFGIVYIYTGGPMQQLQGTASFYKRQNTSIANAVAKLELLGLTKDGVSVVLLGSMTKDQIKKAKRNARIRPEKILNAVKWLIRNNVDWSSIDLELIKAGLQNPIIVKDESRETDEVQTNVESTETFRVFFPDGRLQSGLGGQQTSSDFLRAALQNNASVNDENSNGDSSLGASSGNVYLQANFENERVYDYKDKNLVNSCIIQFPFGRGGLMSEKRYDGKKLTHEEYIEHLSKMSQPHFQGQLFTLILFNYLMKDWMVRKAGIACKNEATATMLAENLSSAELFEALEQRRNKKPITSASARKMISTLEAVAACAPHTNEAAKKAKYQIEAMQCHFGLPNWFLTVTPDDENSVLLQVYSGKDISLKADSWEHVENLSDEELAVQGIQKKSLRIDYPGIAALNFENQRDAIIQHVLGWDTKKKCRTKVEGLFGKCRAFALSVEEQGRKSLHMHILIWIESIDNAFSSIFANKRKREAEVFLCDEINRVSSCELIGSTERLSKRKKVFHHNDCVKFSSLKRPRQPGLISAQRLRDLRNSKGMKVNPEHMKCHYCDAEFASHHLIANYLKYLGMEKLSCFPDNGSKRVKAMAMALINGGGKDDRAIPIYNAAYNHHEHTKVSCFCKGSGRCTTVDCRYRYPKLPHTQTTLITSDTNSKWYRYDGSYQPRSIFETAPRREVADVFMNQYCLGVGMTKLINGNTNVSLLSPGPIACYTTGYTTKGTQKQDSAEYDYLSERVQKAVHRLDIENLERKEREKAGTISEAERKATNESAAITKVLRLGFTRHEPNIVGAPMASYLIRNKSRFIHSHQFHWVPVWDIETLLSGGTVKRYLQNGKYGSYFSNSAYDYICRPEECENISLFEFINNCDVVRQRPTKENGLMKFLEVNGLIHPSWNDGKNNQVGNYRAGVRWKSIEDDDPETKTEIILQIPSYFLPDTATFGGTIDSIITKETEEYCRRALLLFKPFRTVNDLRSNGQQTQNQIELLERKRPAEGSAELAFVNDIKENGSFTESYAIWLGEQSTNLRKQKAIKFLQNFQDCHYNCTRNSSRSNGDELDRMTRKYRSQNRNTVEGEGDSIDSDDEDPTQSHIENCFFDEAELTELVGMLCPERSLDSNGNQSIPSHYLTKSIRDKGKFRCGYEHIALMDPHEQPRTGNSNNVDSTTSMTERFPWLEIGGASDSGRMNDIDTQNNLVDPIHNATVPSKEEIFEIIVKRTERILRKDKLFRKNVSVVEANGSRDSIRMWSKEARLDLRQRAAFEIIIASFVLTFFEENGQGEEDRPVSTPAFEGETSYAMEKKKLEALADVEKRGSKQLVSLLYGAGGSGKSFVIDLVLLYAKEYCSKFENFVFDKRTIVVTAMTGCAATLLNGETAHGALKLNTKTKNLDQDDIDGWRRTRLLIIDEISFASQDVMDEINSRLKFLRELEESNGTWFGGIHMVLAGDFRQLDPVSRPPLYMTSYGLEQKVNCFLELTGMHRFRKDPEWGELLKKFRDGNVSKHDIDTLNKHIKENNKALPNNLKYATYRNSDRDAINTALFDKAIGSKSEEEAQKFALLVFADEVHLRTGKGQYSKRLGTCDMLYHHVSESDVKTTGTSSQRMDPVLKLYEGIRVLLTKNEDVSSGIANGTQAEVTRIVLKSNERYSTIKVKNDDNERGGVLRTVKAVFASQIDYVELRHLNDRVPVPLFRLSPQAFMFTVTLPSPSGDREIGMKATQLPIIVNNATTGHKLQGSTVDSIFVHEWSKTRNWNYVVLSRVRERKGLFARKPLPNNPNLYRVPEKLQEMMRLLKFKEPSDDSFRHSEITM